ncbi:MAG: Holliday junction resolvase Hjc [Candidatus ainarchaeum sp.]|nr:Holliday junction resolvase Hjc [Candidatus ainarchaeum sp.]
MANYVKGARSERELIRLFSEKGYSVIRAAGSGVAGGCPDLLAFRRGAQYAFECKAWNAERVAIDRRHYLALRAWEENTGITTMVAWKIDRIGWHFIYLSELEENPGSHSLSRKRAVEMGRKIDSVLR